TLPTTGTYVIQVQASNLISTGSYSLGRECLLPTNPVDATLACGGLISRSIDGPAQVSQQTFTAQLNYKVTLTLPPSGLTKFVTSTSAVVSPTTAIYVLSLHDALPILTLPTTGTYVIQVQASNLISTGSYSLGRECLLPTSPVDATLACGGLISRSIDGPAQVDQITFSGQINDHVTRSEERRVGKDGTTATATVF